MILRSLFKAQPINTINVVWSCAVMFILICIVLCSNLCHHAEEWSWLAYRQFLFLELQHWRYLATWRLLYFLRRIIWSCFDVLWEANVGAFDGGRQEFELTIVSLRSVRWNTELMRMSFKGYQTPYLLIYCVSHALSPQRCPMAGKVTEDLVV